jgi:hypothetical protein
MFLCPVLHDGRFLYTWAGNQAAERARGAEQRMIPEMEITKFKNP